MTRQEFIEDVNSFYDLIDFCRDENLDVCDDIYDAEYANETIIQRLREYTDWEDAYRFLDDIPEGCEYYREDGYGDLEDAEEYFEDYKEDVLRVMDDGEYWDEEDDDDYFDDYEEEEEIAEDDSEETEDIPTDALFAVLGKAG